MMAQMESQLVECYMAQRSHHRLPDRLASPVASSAESFARSSVDPMEVVMVDVTLLPDLGSDVPGVSPSESNTPSRQALQTPPTSGSPIHATHALASSDEDSRMIADSQQIDPPRTIVADDTGSASVRSSRKRCYRPKFMEYMKSQRPSGSFSSSFPVEPVDNVLEQPETPASKRQRALKRAVTPTSVRRNRSESSAFQEFVVHEEANALCVICGDGDSCESNPILFCDGDCHFAYHQSCISLPRVPDDDQWICPGCSDNSKGTIGWIRGLRVQAQRSSKKSGDHATLDREAASDFWNFVDSFFDESALRTAVSLHQHAPDPVAAMKQCPPALALAAPLPEPAAAKILSSGVFDDVQVLRAIEGPDALCSERLHGNRSESTSMLDGLPPSCRFKARVLRRSASTAPHQAVSVPRSSFPYACVRAGSGQDTSRDSNADASSDGACTTYLHPALYEPVPSIEHAKRAPSGFDHFEMIDFEMLLSSDLNSESKLPAPSTDLAAEVSLISRLLSQQHEINQRTKASLLSRLDPLPSVETVAAQREERSKLIRDYLAMARTSMAPNPDALTEVAVDDDLADSNVGADEHEDDASAIAAEAQTTEKRKYRRKTKELSSLSVAKTAGTLSELRAMSMTEFSPLYHQARHRTAVLAALYRSHEMAIPGSGWQEVIKQTDAWRNDASSRAGKQPMQSASRRRQIQSSKDCVCGLSGQHLQRWLTCEHCLRWFHPACLGLEELMLWMVEAFICPACVTVAKRRTQFLPPPFLNPDSFESYHESQLRRGQVHLLRCTQRSGASVWKVISVDVEE